LKNSIIPNYSPPSSCPHAIIATDSRIREDVADSMKYISMGIDHTDVEEICNKNIFVWNSLGFRGSFKKLHTNQLYIHKAGDRCQMFS